MSALGFTLELPTGVHDSLTRERARRIISQLPAGIIPVVVTYIGSGLEAAALAREVGAAAVQFHGDIPDEEVVLFRRELPHVRTVARVTVTGETSVALAAALQPSLWDAVILDSLDPATGHIGATGLTHDWSISAKIVEVVQIPVILAGGLTPDNVAQAIAAVHPQGVDVHTGIENPDGSRNFGKIARFTRVALESFGVRSV